MLGVSGSVACYRACDIARELMRHGHDVKVCLTDSAQKFIKPELFEALTKNPCLQDTFEEPEKGKMAHIDLARKADLILIAPATANIINKLAAGLADDMLSTIALAYEGPIAIAPAMNPTMYANEITQQSLATLEARGAEVISPAEGEVACGEQGQGKLASIQEIVTRSLEVINRDQVLQGKDILITCGPTQEPIDSVRYLTNRSSGKMGVALARTAIAMGARVTLVTGPITVQPPTRARVIQVRTAIQMLDASLEAAKSADIIVGAAAVSDYRILNPAPGKLRRQDGVPEFKLEPNPDIIAQLAMAAKPGCKVIAFAAEPSSDASEARHKLDRKGVSAIVFNDVSNPLIGFESDENEITLITGRSEEKFGKASKVACAAWLWQKIVALP